MLPLEDVFPVKSYDEIQEIVNEHLHCKSTTSVVVEKTVDSVVSTPDPDLEEDVPMFENSNEDVTKPEEKEKPAKQQDIDIPDDLLEGLDDL